MELLASKLYYKIKKKGKAEAIDEVFDVMREMGIDYETRRRVEDALIRRALRDKLL